MRTADILNRLACWTPPLDDLELAADLQGNLNEIERQHIENRINYLDSEHKQRALSSAEKQEYGNCCCKATPHVNTDGQLRQLSDTVLFTNWLSPIYWFILVRLISHPLCVLFGPSICPRMIMDKKQQSRLKLLIEKGKEQGFLTYAEVNDHLPEDIVDPQQIEDIIGMINDMGILVHEVAPDSDSLLLASTKNSADEDAAEEAAANLVTVDSEFGRTTDPVRMYMREMGTVELLTREGEIVIAKRIEDGLNQVLLALASYPETAATLLRGYERVDAGEMRLNDLISGFIDPNAEEPQIPEPAQVQATNSSKDDDDDPDDESDEPVDTGPDPEEAKQRFAEIEKVYTQLVTAHSEGR